MPDFRYDPGDSRFLGSPVDFVVFAGLWEADEVEQIVFVEVKTGKRADCRAASGRYD